MAAESEREKYNKALVIARSVRCLVSDTFECAVKDNLSADKSKLKEKLNKLENKLTELEKIGGSLTKLPEDRAANFLGKSGLLWLDPIQDKTPLYDQLLQTYSWTQKLNSQAKLATRTLKRHHVCDETTSGELLGGKKSKESFLYVSQKELKQVVEQIKKSFPKLAIRWNKIAGVSLLQVSVKLTLNAIIILNGCSIDRVMIKGIEETSDDKDEFMQCSQHKIFNKMTDIANAATFYYATCNDPKKTLNKFLVWLMYYEKLFVNKCTKCQKHLQKDLDGNFFPPCWITFEDYKPYHLQCKP